jgi:peptidoglycan hydrolase-like protein with peptidoglycan-binding domain
MVLEFYAARLLRTAASFGRRGGVMSNPSQPTIQEGARGEPVRRLQRALRRALPDPSLAVDGVFGPKTKQRVEGFQQGAGLQVDGVVGPATWGALPDGGPMPLLQQGSTGRVVQRLQEVLAAGAGPWVAPGPADGNFGPNTRRSVEGFQRWAGLPADGVVGDQTWAASLGAASATLETAVGLDFVTG